MDNVDKLKEGMVLPPQQQWKGRYNAWRRVIGVFLHYNRPLTIREIAQYTKDTTRELREDILPGMIEEGLISYPIEVMTDHHKYYRLNWEQLQGKVKIVPQDEIAGEHHNIDAYVMINLRGDEFYNEALNMGLKDETEISEYILDKVYEALDERSARHAKRNSRKSK